MIKLPPQLPAVVPSNPGGFDNGPARTSSAEKVVESPERKPSGLDLKRFMSLLKLYEHYAAAVTPTLLYKPMPLPTVCPLDGLIGSPILFRFEPTATFLQ